MKNEFLSPHPLPTGPSQDPNLHSPSAHTPIPLILTQSPTFVSCPSSDSHLAQQPLIQALYDTFTSAQF